MTNQKIKCPQCSFEFLPDEALSHQLEEKYRLEYEAKQKQKDLEISEKEKALTEKAQKIEAAKLDLIGVVNRQVEEKLKTEKVEIEKRAKEEAVKETSAEVDGLKEVLKQKDTKLEELRKDQVELMKEKQSFEDEKKAFELDMMKKEQEITQKVSQEVTGQLGDKYKLQIAEKDKKLSDAEKAIDGLTRKLQQGSQQSQGEILEVELEELLRQAFIYDDILPVPKGDNGADVIQRVKNNYGKVCGTIVWESKRTKNWTDTWIPKLKDDKRREKADLAVIVSIVMPEDIKTFGLRDGVMVVNFNSVIALTTILRSQLIDLSNARTSGEDRGKKSEIVYNYLTSNDFKQRIEVWLEYFTSRQKELNIEKAYFTKKWEKEEKNMQKVYLNTAGIYGDLQGLIGTALPKIDMLELPEGEEDTIKIDQ
ncbi:MAG: DUF2130 domain-containing protein [Candidatus Shapirobacteria bacterium]|jgi:hypothetical protein